MSTSGAPRGRPPRRRGGKRWWVRGAALAGLAALVAAVSASSAPPAFPDNIVVFPDRDFVSFEGFQDHVGETALVEVTRPGTGVVGSARAVIAEGDVPFEINHPGGVCWGAGTGLNVTPDIQPGDVLSLEVAGQSTEVTTLGAYVTSVDYVDGATTFTVTGHVDAGINPDNLEQRIVNPDLTDTAVGRRTVRAVTGPLTADDSGAYSSGLVVNGTTATATYVFTDPEIARTAATGGGHRMMSWETTDAAANRQGLTIAEFGELGGPGMGGCPNGPLQAGPPGPTNVTATTVSGGIRVDWTPASAIPGTPAITGYRVTAVGQTVTGSTQVEIGRRISNPAARTTTITGLDSGDTYDIEIVSVSGSGTTFPAINVPPVTDTTPPTISANPGPGTFAQARNVALTSSETHSEIYYTLDGSDPLVGPEDVSPDAVLYTGAINVAVTTRIRAVAFDPAGNVSDEFDGTYTIDGAGVVPGAPTIDASSVGLGSITVDWSLDPAFTVDEYRVSVTDADGTPRADVTPNPRITTDSDITITGLTEGVDYYVTVIAANANGPGPASDRVGPLRPLGAVVANAGPDQTVTRALAPTTVTLNGAGSTAGATYLWEQIGASPANTVVLNNPNAIGPTFQLPLFLRPMTNDPLVFRLTVTQGVTVRSDEVRVTPVAGDTTQVVTAKWKAGDFRVDGVGSVNGATIRVHSGSLDGPILGQATVTADAWQLRLRNAAAPAARPPGLWIESTLGSTSGPYTVN